MNAGRKGLVLAAVQLGLVLSLGAKLVYDRATRPRVWVLAATYDPDLPIRGRYLSERLQLPAEGFTYNPVGPQNPNAGYSNRHWAYLEMRDGQLIAKPDAPGDREWISVGRPNGKTIAYVEEPVLIFIAEHAVVPALKPGEETWVEVTVPAKGPPRPLRMGIKKDGVITPLQIR
jgi:hypothetical protein